MPVLTPEPPVAAPTTQTTTLGQQAWDALPEYMREADDGTLRALLDALGAPVQAGVDILTRPEVSTDPAQIPFARLPWLAAMSGIDLTGVPDADKRAVVADPAWLYRGSRDAIVRRVGMTLTGARQVTVECPHLGDEWAMYVRTLASETPDSTVTEASIDAEAPAWLTLTTDVAATGMTYDALAAAYDDYDAMTATGKTYSELAAEV